MDDGSQKPTTGEFYRVRTFVPIYRYHEDGYVKDICITWLAWDRDESDNYFTEAEAGYLSDFLKSKYPKSMHEVVEGLDGCGGYEHLGYDIGYGINLIDLNYDALDVRGYLDNRFAQQCDRDGNPREDDAA